MIPGYKILDEIGKGGMATVFKAMDGNNQFVAIKMLNDAYKHNEIVRKRFENEAKAMQMLDHPNIVKVIDFINFDDELAIVMELIDGVSLQQLIRRNGKLTERATVSLMNQILSALDYAHQRGIIHRDIKPSNFIINKKNIVKVIDFGVAKFAHDDEELNLTKAGTEIGTVSYMSPEQVKDSKTLDNLTDIYSLGVMLYFMLTGKHPYNLRELSSFDIKEKIVNEPLPTIDNLPSFSKVIAKATEKKPQNRYLSCGQFHQALIQALQSPSSKQSEGNSSKIVKLLIGRSLNANIIINKPYISRKHAILFIDVRRKEFVIEDLNSTSGTYVNGKKIINTKINLKKGDVVNLGNYQLNWSEYVDKVLKDESVEIERDNEESLISGTTTHTSGNTLFDNYLKAMSKYVDFNGRASVREFWSFVLFTFLFYFGGALLIVLTNNTDLQHADADTLAGIFGYFLSIVFVHFLPGLAVMTRRLQDTNHPWWFMFIPIYNFILTIMEGDSGSNEYGNKN